MVSGTTPSNHRNTLKSQIIDGRNLSEDGKSIPLLKSSASRFMCAARFIAYANYGNTCGETSCLIPNSTEDLYAGTIDVLKVEVPSPSAFEELFKEINHQFSDLSYYDVDIPLICAMPQPSVSSHCLLQGGRFW